jgi:galactan endo-1,6-beta-galactosidase
LKHDWTTGRNHGQVDRGGKWVGSAYLKYFVVAQYKRHIRPDMPIIDAMARTVAACDSVAQTLVLLAANFKIPQWISCRLKNFPEAGGVSRSWLTVGGTGPSCLASTSLMVAEHGFRAWIRRMPYRFLKS